MCVGFPNVGKSAIVNAISNANMDVQLFAFTTRMLSLGHVNYGGIEWQVLDTPGILNKPLEERNTIEMMTIMALAHLRATTLFVVDISEECGWAVAEQVALFNAIKPLFTSKPVVCIVYHQLHE